MAWKRYRNDSDKGPVQEQRLVFCCSSSRLVHGLLAQLFLKSISWNRLLCSLPWHHADALVHSIGDAHIYLDHRGYVFIPCQMSCFCVLLCEKTQVEVLHIPLDILKFLHNQFHSTWCMISLTTCVSYSSNVLLPCNLCTILVFAIFSYLKVCDICPHSFSFVCNSCFESTRRRETIPGCR